MIQQKEIVRRRSRAKSTRRALYFVAFSIGVACSSGAPNPSRLTTTTPVGWLGEDSLIVLRLDRLGDSDALMPSCDSSGLWLVVAAQSPIPHRLTERLCKSVFSATGATLSRDGRHLYFTDANWDGRIIRFDIAADSSEIVFEHACLAVPGEAVPSAGGGELLVLSTCGPELSRRAWRVRPTLSRQREPLSAVADESASSLSWGPGDSLIAFAVRHDDSESPEVVVARSDSQLQRVLVDGDYPSWSPQGDWIAFVSWVTAQTQQRSLELISSDGTRRRVLATTDTADSTHPRWTRGGAGPLRWSADGREIAFGTPCGVGVARADGTGLRTVSIGSSVIRPACE